MSWRVVIITGVCKLEYKIGYLVCRGEETKRIFLSEISSLIVESTAVSLTCALLCELIKNKINVVFCDEKHNPLSQLLSLRGRHDCSGRLRNQLEWKDESKRAVWTQIVRHKILAQYRFLKDLKSDRAEMLAGYIKEVQDGDTSNREGHAAKVYFDSLFGLEFNRGDDTFINSALNYGYTVLLAAFNREIVAQGYNTQLGLAHKSEFNAFNLACDLMEPFRVMVDRFVFSGGGEMNTDYKHAICDILNTTVKIRGTNQTLTAAIGYYCSSVFAALENDNADLIDWYEL